MENRPNDLDWIGKDAGRVWMADDFDAPLIEFEREFYENPILTGELYRPDEKGR